MTVSFNPVKNFEVEDAPNSIALGDFNGDGNSDLAVNNQNTDTVSVLLGDGSGSFEPAKNFEVGDVPFSVTVGDFNGDG